MCSEKGVTMATDVEIQVNCCGDRDLCNLGLPVCPLRLLIYLMAVVAVVALRT